MMWGAHCFKSWASTQATVALSSAEAELYALTKGVSQALGVMTLLEDFSLRTRSVLHTDASAAIGIVRRAGLGKLRHLNVRYLWLQDHLRGGQMDLHKVAGVANAADLVTKHLGPGKAKDHLEAIGVSLEGGRAASAPNLNQAAELGRWRGSGGGSGGSGGSCGVEGSGGLPVLRLAGCMWQDHANTMKAGSRDLQPRVLPISFCKERRGQRAVL